MSCRYYNNYDDFETRLIIKSLYNSSETINDIDKDKSTRSVINIIFLTLRRI